jgi:hypothetical protein
MIRTNQTIFHENGTINPFSKKKKSSRPQPIIPVFPFTSLNGAVRHISIARPQQLQQKRELIQVNFPFLDC